MFTVLLAVHRNADLLPFAIETVLWQTIPNFELFIICDGAPQETIECATQYAKKDPRIRVFPFPKGERHGEHYRHLALQEAKGAFIAHIADDDLWFPNHLEEISRLLQDADFGNVLFHAIDPHQPNTVDGRYVGDLSDSKMIERMLKTKFNFFGPTVAGYTLSAYRQLPQGWSPAPLDIWTDLYMWRKFLSHPGLKCKTRIAVTACHFPTYLRTHFSSKERQKETQAWFEKIKCPNERDHIQQLVLKALNLEVYRLQESCSALYNSRSWRLTKPLRLLLKFRHLMLNFQG